VGYEEVETNARGRVLRVLKRTDPKPGKDIVLSLDIKLQEAAEAALGGRRGAVVALDPRTGEVLAMVSQPSFDPNLFVTGISFKAYAELRDSIDRPLFNRVLRGLYPAGFDHQAGGGHCRPRQRGGQRQQPGLRPGLLPVAQLRSQIP
jgi:Cell division protein FtsI/penicillin-binding protein 2